MKYKHEDKLNKRWFPYDLVVWKDPRSNRNSKGAEHDQSRNVSAS